MSRKVILSKRAEKTLEKLFLYLSENWSAEVKFDFITKLERSVELLQDYPESFPESSAKTGLHKCVITKQISLYYTFDSENIKILTVFDNRQDPKKLNPEL